MYVDVGTVHMDRGGQVWGDNFQLVEYHIDNDNFNDYGRYYLKDVMNNSHGENEFGGYYTQLNCTMMYTLTSWWANGGNHIGAYNLEELSYQQQQPTIPNGKRHFACLASSETPSPRLYVTGGEAVEFHDRDRIHRAFADLQVLDLDQMIIKDSRIIVVYPPMLPINAV